MYSIHLPSHALKLKFYYFIIILLFLFFLLFALIITNW